MVHGPAHCLRRPANNRFLHRAPIRNAGGLSSAWILSKATNPSVDGIRKKVGRYSRNNKIFFKQGMCPSVDGNDGIAAFAITARES